MSYSKTLTGIIVLLTVVVVASLPWPFACVSPQVARWLFYVGCLFWLLFICRWLITFRLDGNNQSLELTWPKGVQHIALLGTLGLFWGALQLAPLPKRFLSIVAPANARVWQAADGTLAGENSVPRQEAAELHTGGAGLDVTVSRWRPISFYPSYGRRACEWLALGMTFFLFAASIARQRTAAAILVGSIALTGFAVAAFGLVQKLTWNGFIYWYVPFPWIAEPFGPFVNRNNAAGYINLAIGAGLGIAGYLWTNTRSAFTRLVVAAALLLVTGTLVTGILASGSRGGLISLLIATLAVLWFVLGHKVRRGWVYVSAAALVLLMAIGLLGWLTDGSVWQRYATLLDWNTYASDGRVMNWQAAGRALTHFPVFGTGYGTYRYAYGPYEERYSAQWLVHAENVFVEVALEGGFVAGLLLVTAILAATGSLCWTKAAAALTSPLYMRVAGLYVLVSQVVHNVMDLGIYVPANMLTFATLMGVLLGSVARKPDDEVSDAQLSSGKHCAWLGLKRYVPHLAMAIWAAVVLCGAYHIGQYAAVEEQVRLVRRAAERRQALSDTDLARSIDQLSRALQRYPHSAEGWLTLAELRMEAYQRVARNYKWPLSEELAAQSHHWETLFAATTRAYSQSDAETINRLRTWPPVLQWLWPAYIDLIRARGLCPAIGKVHLGLAKLAWLNTASPAYDGHLAAAVYCAPADPSVLIPAAMMHLLAGDYSMARQLLDRVEQLQPQLKDRLRKALPPDLVRGF